VGDWAGCEDMSAKEADLVAKGMDPFMTTEEDARYTAKWRIQDVTKEAVALAKDGRREE
jgi:hypothetical protein